MIWVSVHLFNEMFSFYMLIQLYWGANDIFKWQHIDEDQQNCFLRITFLQWDINFKQPNQGSVVNNSFTAHLQYTFSLVPFRTVTNALLGNVVIVTVTADMQLVGKCTTKQNILSQNHHLNINFSDKWVIHFSVMFYFFYYAWGHMQCGSVWIIHTLI